MAVLPKPFRGKGKFADYLPGFLHLDLAYLPFLYGSFQRRHLQDAIDRITKLVFVTMVDGKTQKQSIRFLKVLLRFFPHRVHHILTDNGKEFAKKFTMACQKLGIKHRRIKVKHPWTNGQVETTIKRIKQETIWKTYYPHYHALGKSLEDWVNHYSLKTNLQSIRGLTPAEKVLQYYQELDKEKQKQRFRKKPTFENLKIHSITL